MNLKGKRKAFFKYLGRHMDLLMDRIEMDRKAKDICRCGHTITVHKNGSLYCVGSANGWGMGRFCSCTWYKPADNLKYLELKYERSIP